MIDLLSVVSLIPFYLLGAFPSGYLIAKAQGIDIRTIGSGNVGATNVARVLGKKAGVFTLLLDSIKGLLAVGIASFVSSNSSFPVSAGVAAVCGHCFSLPPWLKGGKGVATALGVIAAFSPTYACGAIAVFVGVFLPSKIVSLSSIAATLAVPLLAVFSGADDAMVSGLVIVSLIVVYRHKQNIKRLIEGNEPRFSSKKS